MWVEEAKALFKKLKIYSLLDLALLIPTSYNDTTLSTSLELGKVVTLEAKVIDTHNYGGKFRVTFMLTASGQRLSSLFFRVTPYHYKLFSVGSNHVIQGKLENYNGQLQISQPKSVQSVGKITPKYKSILKHSEITALIQAYISPQNLLKEGLETKEIEILMQLHFPKNLEYFDEKGKLKPTTIAYLKSIECFNHLKKLKRKRRDFPALKALDGSIEPFIDALPFTLTPEQQSVIAQIKQDLHNAQKATKRMVVGDVGSGKTMVILASVMMALPHKSILMAPTSLLALQLFEEASKFLPKTVKLALVMQGNEQGNYEDADFIIGTHALLYKESLPQSPLVMIDEQHRFGTKQRQSLEALMGSQTHKAHVVQFSATPIPRTQAMMQSALLDVSLITSTPFKREVVTKTIGKEEFSTLLQHIQEQIAQQHQVLIIYPLVEHSTQVPYQSLEESSDFWQKRFDNVYLTHGKDKHKEQVLLDFREKGDILLATTVVEVGISLPRLTLIVIVGAERLGLASLHQLRGRVGRNGLKSWCYLYSNSSNNRRLEEFSKTTNGFDIAKLDLQFRDSGDILDGTIQSGERFKWLDMAEDEEVIARTMQRLDT